MSRQSTYTARVAEELVEWISSGQTLRSFCRQEGRPPWRTVYSWIDADPEFAARIARARELGHDAIAEEALAIADTPAEGEITIVEGQGDGKKVTTRREDMLGHRKLQVETRLKLLAKWNPKKYGEKLGIGGADGMGPVPLALDGSDVKG